MAHEPVRRMHGRFFSLTTNASLGAKASQAACVVSKKVSPRATARNLIKRRCRAALAPLLRGHPEPVRIILTAKRAAAGATYAELAEDVRELFERALKHRTTPPFQQ